MAHYPPYYPYLAPPLTHPYPTLPLPSWHQPAAHPAADHAAGGVLLPHRWPGRAPGLPAEKYENKCWATRTASGQPEIKTFKPFKPGSQGRRHPGPVWLIGGVLRLCTGSGQRARSVILGQIWPFDPGPRRARCSTSEDTCTSEIGHDNWTEPFVRPEPSRPVRHQVRGVMARSSLDYRPGGPEASMVILGLILANYGHI